MPALLNCEMCGVDYPSSRFPDLTLGIVCQGCLTGRNPSQMEHAIAEKTKAIANQLMSIDSPELLSGTPEINGILAGVYREFGGPEGFAQHFYWIIQELSRRKPIPAAVGALMISFMKLHHSVEKAQANVTARDMTDEQLRREMELEMMRLVMDSSGDPEKRKMLDKVLGANGLKLSIASPKEIASVAMDDAPIDMPVVESQIAVERFGDASG